MEIIDNLKEKPTDSVDISCLSHKNFSSNNNFSIYIIMSNDDKLMKKYLKTLIKYRKKLNYNLKIYLLNYNENELLHNQFKALLEPIFSKNKEEIYSKAYDLACEYLDSYFYGKNLCDFHNNKCGYKKDYDIEVGCCRHFKKHKQFGLYFGEKLVPCEYLGSDGHCTIKCLCCKLMTCEYLSKKGIKFRQKDIFPIDAIFNWKQKIYIKCKAYTPKEEILKKLMFLA